MLFGEFSENFSIEDDAGFLEFIHKHAIRHAVLPGGGVDFYLPQPPEIPFFLSEILEPMNAGMKKRFFSKPFFCFPAPFKTFCLPKDFPSPF